MQWSLILLTSPYIFTLTKFFRFFSERIILVFCLRFHAYHYCTFVSANRSKELVSKSEKVWSVSKQRLAMYLYLYTINFSIKKEEIRTCMLNLLCHHGIRMTIHWCMLLVRAGKLTTEYLESVCISWALWCIKIRNIIIEIIYDWYDYNYTPL